MADLIRKTCNGVGAETLANAGKNYLNYVDRMVRLFDDPMIDKVYRDTLARRRIVLPDGSTLQMNRGPINRVVANVPPINVPVIDEPVSITGLKFFVALDAWVVTGEAGVEAGILVSPVDDLETWVLLSSADWTIADEIPYLPSFCDVNPEIMYSAVGASYLNEALYEVFPQNRATQVNPITREVHPFYWWTDYTGSGEVTWSEQKSPMVCLFGSCPQSFSVWSANIGGVELIPTYRYYWDYRVTVDPNPPGSGSERAEGNLVYENYYDVFSGAYIQPIFKDAGQYGLTAFKNNGAYPFSAFYSGSGPRDTGGFKWYVPSTPSNYLGWTAEPSPQWDYIARFNGNDVLIEGGLTNPGFYGDGPSAKVGKYYKNDFVAQWYSLFVRLDDGIPGVCLGVVGEDGGMSHKHLAVGAGTWFSGDGYRPGYPITTDDGVFHTTGVARLLFSAPPGGAIPNFNRVVGA